MPAPDDGNAGTALGSVDTLAATPTRGENTARTMPTPGASGVMSLAIVEREHYEILGEFARGGLGRVLRARDRRSGRIVAIKEVLRAGPEAEARFAFEAIVTANLEHPATVPVYEVGRWPSGEPFYAMKLVSGRSLESLIAESRSLRQRVALVPHLIAVAEALAYAHSQRIIHRDLKPANILVGAYGETVVIDWGLAKNLATGDEAVGTTAPTAALPAAAHGETIVGSVLGTPAYMSPEQARGAPVDERTDVYALGAMLYQILGGIRPYAEQSTPAEILGEVVVRPPRPLAVIDVEIPGELRAIVEKAMALDAAARYPTASGLAEDLKRFTTGQLVGAHHYTAWQLVRRWLYRHRAVVAASAIAVVVLAALGAYGIRRIVAERDIAEVERVHAEVERDRADQARGEAERRLGELFAEEGRQMLAAGDSNRALAYLGEAMRRGATNHATRFLVGQGLIDLEPLEAVLSFHTQGAESVDFSPDGTRLVSGGFDGQIAVWDLARRAVVGAVAGGLKASFIPDGRSIVSMQVNGPITMWDAATLAARGTVTLPANGDELPWTIAVAPDSSIFAVAGNRGTLAWWRVDTLSPVATVKTRAARIWTLQISPDSRRLAVAEDDGSVEVWNADGTPYATLLGHVGPAYDATFSPDGKLLASAGDDRTAIVWDLATKKPRVQLRGHTAELDKVVFDPTGTRVATCSLDTTAMEWDVATGRALATMKGHTSNINVIRFSPDGAWIATAGEDGEVNLWDARTGALAARHLGSTLPITALEFSPDGSRLAASSHDARVWVWRVGAVPKILHLGASPHAIAGSFSPDGTLVATAADDLAIRLWDSRTGADKGALLGHTGQINSLAFSADGTRLVSASSDDTVRTWDAIKLTSIATLDGHTGRVRAASFDPRGERIVSISADRTARIWDARTGQVIHVLGPFNGEGRTARFSPDGTRIVTTSEQFELDLWDAATGQHISHYIMPGALVEAIDFSADGARFAAGSQMAPPMIFRTADGTLVEKLVGHSPDRIDDVDFSADGTQLLSAGSDGTARVWDLASGKQLTLLTVATVPVFSARFRPDGALIATGSLDSIARMWEATGGRLLATMPAAGMISAVRFSPDGTHLLVLPVNAPPFLWRVGEFHGSADDMAQILRCSVPFHVEGSGLAPFTPHPAECAPGH